MTPWPNCAIPLKVAQTYSYQQKSDTTSPPPPQRGSPPELETPIALVDGRRCTPGTWAVLLIDTLAALAG